MMPSKLVMPDGTEYVTVETHPSNILTVRYARDPQIIDLLAPEPAEAGMTGNFSHMSHKIGQSTGGFGDVENRVNLGSIGGEWEQYVLTINPAEAKNKLINPDYDSTGKAVKVMWYTQGNLVFGAMIPGSTTNSKNLVRVKTNADGSLKLTRMNVKFPAWPSGTTAPADFVEVDGFRKSDKGRPVAELLAEGRMGWFSEIFSNLKVGRSLGGYPDLLCPYWDQTDFPVNNGHAYLPIAYFEGYGLTI